MIGHAWGLRRMLIYIVLGELIPHPRRLYRGRLPVIGNMLGLICVYCDCINYNILIPY